MTVTVMIAFLRVFLYPFDCGWFLNFVVVPLFVFDLFLFVFL